MPVVRRAVRRITRITRNPRGRAGARTWSPPWSPPPRRRAAGGCRCGAGRAGRGHGIAQSGGRCRRSSTPGAHHGVVELAGASTAHLANGARAWNAALAVAFLWAAWAHQGRGAAAVLAAFVGCWPTIRVFDAWRGRVEFDRLLAPAWSGSGSCSCWRPRGGAATAVAPRARRAGCPPDRSKGRWRGCGRAARMAMGSSRRPVHEQPETSGNRNPPVDDPCRHGRSARVPAGGRRVAIGGRRWAT